MTSKECSYENNKLYYTRYITESNQEFKELYEKCNDKTSTVDIAMKSIRNDLIALMESNINLNAELSNLNNSQASLSNELSESNIYRTQLTESNIYLTDSNNSLSNEYDKLVGISNLVDEMRSHQSNLDLLYDLDGIISEEVCLEMLGGSNLGSNCGLISAEKLTKDKFEKTLQAHINDIPILSTSYILAVKLWIATKKADTLFTTTNHDTTILSQAREAYGYTMKLLNDVEVSMYNIIQLYHAYGRNFYYSEDNIGNISLSNVSETYSNISLIVPDITANDNIYQELCGTCSSSNIDSDSIVCSNLPSEEVEEETLSDDKKQPTPIRSGLEKIYRSNFTRNFINTYSENTVSNTEKSNIDEKIISTFLYKVFYRSTEII
tara:strand:- start:331 stop:1470 length:1140 start_codon:yes stop_codon:yes gene_type:complete